MQQRGCDKFLLLLLRQTYWSQCFCFCSFPLFQFFTAAIAAPLSRHRYKPASWLITFAHLSVTLLTNVLKNNFGMMLEVFFTKQDKIMVWPEQTPEREVMFC